MTSGGRKQRGGEKSEVAITGYGGSREEEEEVSSSFGREIPGWRRVSKTIMGREKIKRNTGGAPLLRRRLNRAAAAT